MKILILLSTILLFGACATTPTMKSVAGVYIIGRYNLTFLENGIARSADGYEKKWKIVDGEIHLQKDDNMITVSRINPDGSISYIANIRDGKRKDRTIDNIETYKKIK